MSIPTLTLNDGRTIPAIGFGTFPHAGDDSRTTAISALGAGYRLLDTALRYENEQGVGRAVREYDLPREDILVATKLAGRHHGYDETIKGFHESLANLGLDHVDIYLIHWPLPRLGKYVDSWKAMVELRDEGLVRSIGVSNFTEEHLRRVIAEGTVVPAVNQIELHPTLTQEDIIAVNDELGIVTEAYSPLGLSADLDNDTVRAVARSVGRSAAQVILRWHLQLGRVVFPKSVTPQRIQENFDVFDFELSEDQIQAISAVNSDNRLGSHPNDFN